jgi:hypothetical protein
MLQAGRSRVPGLMRRMDFFFFSIYLLLPAALDHRVYSASNRSEYQKQKNNVPGGVERGQCVRLTTLPPSVSRLSRQCGILNIPQSHRSPRPVTGTALLFYSKLTSFFPIALRSKKEVSLPHPVYRTICKFI